MLEQIPGFVAGIVTALVVMILWDLIADRLIPWWKARRMDKKAQLAVAKRALRQPRSGDRGQVEPENSVPPPLPPDPEPATDLHPMRHHLMKEQIEHEEHPDSERDRDLEPPTAAVPVVYDSTREMEIVPPRPNLRPSPNPSPRPTPYPRESSPVGPAPEERWTPEVPVTSFEEWTGVDRRERDDSDYEGPERRRGGRHADPSNLRASRRDDPLGRNDPKWNSEDSEPE